MVQGGQAAGTDARLNQFQSALAQQQGDLRKMVDSSSLLSTMGNFRTEFSDEFGSRFDKLESLLAKRHKTEN